MHHSIAQTMKYLRYRGPCKHKRTNGVKIMLMGALVLMQECVTCHSVKCGASDWIPDPLPKKGKS